VDVHGRVTQVVTGATPNTNLGIGAKTASAIEITSSTGSNASIPLVDKANSKAGLMSPTDKTTLDSLASSSGITEVIAGQAITVSASGNDRTVAAIQASTTQIGVIEIATTAEATAGTDTTRAVTPAGVKAVVDAIGSMSSDAAKWDFTNSGTSMYLRYESAQLAQIPVASAGSFDGLMSATDKTNHNTMWSSGLRSLSAGTGISISGTGTTRTITCTVTGDTGVPAILSNGSTPSLNTGITGAEVISLIGAATSGHTHTGVYAAASHTHTKSQITDYETPAITSNGTTPSLNTGITGAEVRSLIGAGTGSGDITGVTAGNGITGGATSGTATVTLGTPGTCSTGSANWVGTSTHTHEVTGFAPLTGATFTGAVEAPSFNATSSRKYKDEVPGEIPDLLHKLNPIKFVYKNDKQRTVHMGYYAEDMIDLYPEAVLVKDGKPEGIDYASLVVPLIQKVCELEARLEALE
jgi:hypothetical protein